MNGFLYPTLIQKMDSFFIYEKHEQDLTENHKYTEMRHGDVILTLQ